MRVVASPEAVDYVRERGGTLFVWVDCLRCQGTVNFLEASTESPGAEHTFRRLSGDEFDLFLDPAELRVPETLQLELRGWRKKRLRALWNGATFAADPRPGDVPGSPA